MNVKMLFFPLSVMVTLFVSVLYIKPEIETAMSNYAVVSEKKLMVTDIDQKIENVHALESSLDANKEDEQAILRYLPSEQHEEYVLDGVNFLAMQSGLAVASIDIEKQALPDTGAALAAGEANADSSVILAPNTDGSVLTQVAAAPVLKTFDVTLDVAGSYENIRDAIEKLSHMDRFQSFSSVSISHAGDTGQSSGDGASDSANILSASFSIQFSYMPKVSVKGNVNSPLLSQKEFDFGVVQKLKQYTSATVPSIDAGTTGRSNPFLR